MKRKLLCLGLILVLVGLGSTSRAHLTPAARHKIYHVWIYTAGFLAGWVAYDAAHDDECPASPYKP